MNQAPSGLLDTTGTQLSFLVELQEDGMDACRSLEGAAAVSQAGLLCFGVGLQ